MFPPAKPHQMDVFNDVTANIRYLVIKTFGNIISPGACHSLPSPYASLPILLYINVEYIACLGLRGRQILLSPSEISLYA